MSIPQHIIKAKSKPVADQQARNGRSVQLPVIAERSEPVIPWEVKDIDWLERKFNRIPAHWFGLILTALLFHRFGQWGLVHGFVATVALGWSKQAFRSSLIWYATKFRPFVAAHARWGCSIQEREHRRSLCGDCQQRYQAKGMNFCRKMQTSCKCGHWWGASLEWLTGLANWSCPKGYFVREVNESSWLITAKTKEVKRG